MRVRHGQCTRVTKCTRAQLNNAVNSVIPRYEFCRACTGKITDLCIIRSFTIQDFLHHLWNDEIQIGVALTVTVAAQVDRHAIDAGRKICPVIQIKPTQEQLIGFTTAAVLGGHEPGHGLQHITGAKNRSLPYFLKGNPPFGGAQCITQQIDFAPDDFDLHQRLLR